MALGRIHMSSGWSGYAEVLVSNFVASDGLSCRSDPPDHFYREWKGDPPLAATIPELSDVIGEPGTTALCGKLNTEEKVHLYPP